MNKDYNYDIRDFQKRSVCLLETMDKVCTEHGLRYYIIAGTLLGAVRNGGFIPWDDDMDIGIMRKDYDRLINHSEEWIPKPFHVVTSDTCSEYPKYFAKIEDTSTTLVENVHLGYKGGIYMDIFPLDDVPDNLMLRMKHYYKLTLVKKLLYFRYRDPFKHGIGIRAIIPLLVHKVFTKEYLHRMVAKILCEYHGCDHCDNVMTHDDGFRCFSKALFGEPCIVRFEGLEVNAPSDYRTFLSVMYGKDYMSPPSPGKRISHFHDYCDFNLPYKDFDLNTLKI